jgi:hypothetical protein
VKCRELCVYILSAVFEYKNFVDYWVKHHLIYISYIFHNILYRMTPQRECMIVKLLHHSSSLRCVLDVTQILYEVLHVLLYIAYIYIYIYQVPY